MIVRLPRLATRNYQLNGTPANLVVRESVVDLELVGEPVRLKQNALRIPHEWFQFGSPALTLSAICQLTFASGNKFFGKRELLAERTGQSIRTVSDHLRRLDADGWIKNHGRQRYRRTPTYSVAPGVRKSFDHAERFLLMPMIAAALPSWNARLVFAKLAFRWLTPIYNSERFHCDENLRCEEIADLDCDYGFATINVTRLAKSLGMTRKSVRRALDAIRDAGLAEIGDRQFTLNFQIGGRR